MKILALETSGRLCGVALSCDGAVVAETNLSYKMEHSTTLMPMLDGLLGLVHTDISEIDVFAVSSGPGSFTGVRIGVCAVKGLADFCRKPVVPVPTLDALAYNVFNDDRLIAPLIDARRGQVYAACYRHSENAFERLTEYCACDETEFLSIVNGLCERLDKKVLFINEDKKRAGAVAMLAERMLADGFEPIQSKELVPFYLRKSQAERLNASKEIL